MSLGFGITIIVLGIALRAWGMFHLKRVGIDDLAGAREPRVYTHEGPYWYTNHPLYIGTAMMMGGAGIMALGWGGGVVAVAAFPYLYERAMIENELRGGR